ncbi:MAG: hypothetical protein ACRC8K_15010 [Waterburya sp.]
MPNGIIHNLSAQLDYTWGKFSNKKAVKATQAKLKNAGITPEKITLETEYFAIPIKLEETQAIADLKVGAIGHSPRYITLSN